ncbi:MAG: hypothetical protein KJ737_17825 [Proteobacteria bacterium]|nr:hypothetical protein [Pseudomonadota bacterium]
MKRLLIGLMIIFMSFVGCDLKSETEKGQDTIDFEKPYLAISVSFNPAAYHFNVLYPQFAIWIEYENDDGELGYHTAFVTRGTGKNQWVWFGGTLVRRPEATPVWSGTRKKETDLDIDAVSGATPIGALFTIYCQVPENINNKKINVYSEVNESMDLNVYYGFHPTNGQPSIVWKASLDMDQLANGQETDSEIIGHGNTWGANDTIYEDYSHVTTGTKLFHYVKVTYFEGGAQ